MIRTQRKIRKYIKQAELIKSRRIDLEDMDIEDGKGQAVLAVALNAIKNNMQTFLETTKGNVVVLSDAIQVINEGADKNRDGSRRISDSLKTIMDKVEEQLETVGECLKLIENNTKRLTEIDESAKGISQSLETTVEYCKSGVSGIEKCEKNMDGVAVKLDDSEKILFEFGNRINEINEINAFIAEISESLNLLSLNASIEASKAGEAGRGFNVISKEMGVIADKTQQGIGNISEILESVIESSEQIKNSIMESIDVFDQTSQEFEAVSASLRSINKQSVDINEKMKDIFQEIDSITDNSLVTKSRAQQAYNASEQIVSGTHMISEASALTADASLKMSENVDSLDFMLNGLEKLLKQYATSVEPVADIPSRQIKIGVFCILDNDFWRSVRRGAIYAKKELEALGAEIRYIPFYKWSEVTSMGDRIDDMMREDFDGFLCPGFMAGSTEKLARAHDAGKKVFVFNCDASDITNRDGVFQPDALNMGARAAEEMARALNKKGKVAILYGDPGVLVNKYRKDSFIREMQKYKGIKIVESTLVGDTEEATYEAACELIARNHELDGIYITTGIPLPVARAIEESGRNISLVVFDPSADVCEYIKKGIITAAIGQDPFSQGHDPIIWMYNTLVTGRPLPDENMIIKANVVDRNNVNSLVEI